MSVFVGFGDGCGPDADLNGDGRVDGADLGLMLVVWDDPGPEDLDGNGVVNGGDLGLRPAARTG